MGVRSKERLVCVLPMNINEQIADGTQEGQAYQLSIGMAATAPICVNLSG